MPAVTFTTKLTVDKDTGPDGEVELEDRPQPDVLIAIAPNITNPNCFANDLRRRLGRTNPIDMGRVKNSTHSATDFRAPKGLMGSPADALEFETVMTTVCGASTPARASVEGLKLQVMEEGNPAHAKLSVLERPPGVTMS